MISEELLEDLVQTELRNSDPSILQVRNDPDCLNGVVLEDKMGDERWQIVSPLYAIEGSLGTGFEAGEDGELRLVPNAWKGSGARKLLKGEIKIPYLAHRLGSSSEPLEEAIVKVLAPNDKKRDGTEATSIWNMAPLKVLLGRHESLKGFVRYMDREILPVCDFEGIYASSFAYDTRTGLYFTREPIAVSDLKKWSRDGVFSPSSSEQGVRLFRLTDRIIDYVVSEQGRESEKVLKLFDAGIQIEGGHIRFSWGSCLDQEYVRQRFDKKVRDRLDQLGLLVPSMMRFEEKARVARDLIGAVAECHRRGIIHGDIKPDNVLIMRSGQGETSAKLSDFDMAFLKRESSDPERRDVAVVGPSTTSRDFNLRQLGPDAERKTEREDVISLGRTLFYLFTGHSIFTRDHELYGPRVRAPTKQKIGLINDVEGTISYVEEIFRRKEMEADGLSSGVPLGPDGKDGVMGAGVSSDSREVCKPDPVPRSYQQVIRKAISGRYDTAAQLKDAWENIKWWESLGPSLDKKISQGFHYLMNGALAAFLAGLVVVGGVGVYGTIESTLKTKKEEVRLSQEVGQNRKPSRRIPLSLEEPWRDNLNEYLLPYERMINDLNASPSAKYLKPGSLITNDLKKVFDEYVTQLMADKPPPSPDFFKLNLDWDRWDADIDEAVELSGLTGQDKGFLLKLKKGVPRKEKKRSKDTGDQVTQRGCLDPAAGMGSGSQRSIEDSMRVAKQYVWTQNNIHFMPRPLYVPKLRPRF